MADCVAGAVEEVEGAVTEVVVGRELADVEGGGPCEGNFAEGAVPTSLRPG